MVAERLAPLEGWGPTEFIGCGRLGWLANSKFTVTTTVVTAMITTFAILFLLK